MKSIYLFAGVFCCIAAGLIAWLSDKAFGPGFSFVGLASAVPLGIAASACWRIALDSP